MGGLIGTIVLIFIVIRIVKKTQNDASTINRPTNPGASARADIKSTASTISVANATPVSGENQMQRVVKANNTSIKNSGVNKDLRGGTQGSNQVVNNRSRTTITSLSASMENRGNDWLAKQLAEERIAKKRMSDMFNLKQQHEDNCDAARNRAMHYNNCDAGGVDIAKG
ncbi:MAG: hypothetical protein KBS96_04365 [Lachnospiraceae bacterium]|nr:hypothetical protein [Candidatus Colinaster scatohippi]